MICFFLLKEFNFAILFLNELPTPISSKLKIAPSEIIRINKPYVFESVLRRINLGVEKNKNNEIIFKIKEYSKLFFIIKNRFDLKKLLNKYFTLILNFKYILSILKYTKNNIINF